LSNSAAPAHSSWKFTLIIFAATLLSMLDIDKTNGVISESKNEFSLFYSYVIAIIAL
jgi:hypothetical protein